MNYIHAYTPRPCHLSSYSSSSSQIKKQSQTSNPPSRWCTICLPCHCLRNRYDEFLESEQNRTEQNRPKKKAGPKSICYASLTFTACPATPGCRGHTQINRQISISNKTNMHTCKKKECICCADWDSFDRVRRGGGKKKRVDERDQLPWLTGTAQPL